MTHNDAGMTAERTAPPADTSDDSGDPTLLYLLGRIDRVIRQAIGNVVKAQGLSAGSCWRPGRRTTSILRWTTSPT
jgi:hypothetical protein